MSKMTLTLLLLPELVIAVTVHEFAHAWMASRLGDNFARRQGRVSLNPLRHLSPLGTLAILFIHFGWGRPVPINLYQCKRPRRDALLISLAGPVANLVLIGICWLLLHLTRHPFGHGQLVETLLNLAHTFLLLLVLINALLAAINLLPIPPLDGSRIWPVLIPSLKTTFGKKTSLLGLGLLLVLIYTHSLRPMFQFISQGIFQIMPISDSEIFDDLLEQGHQEYDREHYAEAERHFTDALAINPDSDAALCMRASARIMLDKWQEALEDMYLAIKINDRYPSYYDLRAEILEHLGRDSEASADRKIAESLRVLEDPSRERTRIVESGLSENADTQPGDSATSEPAGKVE